MVKPSIYELWQQAGGESAHTFDRDLFVALMSETPEACPYPSRTDLEAAMGEATQERSGGETQP